MVVCFKPVCFKRLIGLMLAAAVITTTTISLADAQTANTRAKSYTAASNHRSHTRSRHYAATAAPQRQIACTQFGCNPVPPGCHPEPQRYFSGMTTGFDAVVCR
jgi:hypothetical protein